MGIDWVGEIRGYESGLGGINLSAAAVFTAQPARWHRGSRLGSLEKLSANPTVPSASFPQLSLTL